MANTPRIYPAVNYRDGVAAGRFGDVAGEDEDMTGDAASTDTFGSDAAAVAALLTDGRPLHRHPGPVLLLDWETLVVAANPPALGIVHGLLTGTAPRVTALASAAFAKSGPVQSLKVSDEDAGTTTALCALLLDDGAHLLLIGLDVSLDSNLRTTLVESRRRYKNLVEISADFAWETNAAGTFAFVSPGGGLGYRPEDLVGRQAMDFVDFPEGVDIDLPFTARAAMHDAEFRFHRAGGGIADLIASALPLHDDDGVWQGARGICRDVSEDRARDAALARAQNRERLTAYIARAIRDEIKPAAVLSAAAAAIARALSVDGCRILRIDGRGGFNAVSTRGDPPADSLIVLDSAAEGPVHATGATYHAVARTTRYQRSVNGAVVLWRTGAKTSWQDEDIALLGAVAGQIGVALQQIAAHEHLEKLSTTDPLTGLLNRRTFTERLRAMIDAGGREAATTGVLAYVDLDYFKLVNDGLGHQAGDAALIAVANALRAAVRQDDLIARLGGDEFAIWLGGADIALAEARAHDLIANTNLVAPYVVDPARPLGMSIGLAGFDSASEESFDALLARADAAMYEIKRGGRNGLAVAPPAAFDITKAGA
jgi:diguanylate cyclase (GGDEF)-like protein/PAS domain S-box-containing protein